jgi:hypothetical protein
MQYAIQILSKPFCTFTYALKGPVSNVLKAQRKMTKTYLLEQVKMSLFEQLEESKILAVDINLTNQSRALGF